VVNPIEGRDKMPGIYYRITNTETGLSYVGRTQRTLEVRWREHILSSKYDSLRTLLSDAIKEYGPDVFVIEVIEKCPTRPTRTREAELIDQYGTEYPNGYNRELGMTSLRQSGRDWYQAMTINERKQWQIDTIEGMKRK
jgi:group I intron endonuclease